ncbi:MAG: cytochrome c3 family protein [Lewinellaceae bacterium]|nr:cytochrome c3 family protein [Lewinellaceae bacterium]
MKTPGRPLPSTTTPSGRSPARIPTYPIAPTATPVEITPLHPTPASAVTKRITTPPPIQITPAIGIPTDCQNCHTSDGWMPATFPIHNNYYQLNGAHAAIANDCAACHNGNYNNTPNTCAGCHQPDYNATTNPNHAANQFPTDCTQCHDENAWAPATFDHNAVWPLTGAHASVPNCTDCHIGGNYTNTPNTCAGCHQTDYDATTNPNHLSNQFGTNCTQCHDENAWVPSTFDHNTAWPLTGAHASVPNCTDCHIGGNYTNTPNTCAGCHQPDYNATTNPNHPALGIPTDCETCHTNDGWIPAEFPIHNNYYQLNGAHAAIANDCAACHNGNYNNTPNTCAGCHLPDYNATTNPNHSAANFPTDCTQCHNESAWVPSTFDHNTIWPLNGAHAIVNCTDCHIGGNFNNTPNTCAGCHQADYNATTNPNHSAANFPTDCTQCHNESAWVPSTFDHNTIWPLNGAHAAIVNCTDCHIGGNFNNTPNTCVGCHQADYNATTNPNHSAANFPTDCTQCHNESAWVPSTFDHNTIWPLNGAHAAIVNCTDCHIGGNFNNTPNTCVGCHQADYNGATNPNHLSAGFPTDCALCHNENAWEPSTFDHDNMYFPIYSGKHDEEWNTCADCHTTPGNFLAFSLYRLPRTR